MIVPNYLGLICLSLMLKFGDCLYEYCNNTYHIPSNKIIVNSPYYGDKYPSGSSCMYHITAPIDYVIQAVCTISFDKDPNRCTTEYFYLHTDGDTSQDLIGSNSYCGNGVVQQTSLFNRMTIAYESRSRTNGGKFSCEFTIVKETTCDCGWTVSSKITGGTAAGINEFPSIVKVQLSSKQFCGGIIIAHRHVITAAHCVSGYTPSQLTIISGEHYTKSQGVNKYYGRMSVMYIKVHEYYNAQSNLNDIAMLTTATNFEWSRGVGPACLPWLYERATFENQPVAIVGYGTTSFSGPVADVLQKATVNVISNSNCQQYFQSIYQSQVCTMSPPKDSCQLDSGGPVYYTNTVSGREFVVSIISYGSFCGSNNPSVNTRITYYLQWILSNSVGAECRKT